MKKYSYAFLNLKNHPRGNQILQTLVENGFPPSLVVEEDSRLAARNCSALTHELLTLDQNIFPLAKRSEDIVSGINALSPGTCQQISVPNHNNKNSVAAIRNAGVDFLILGDCRIMKEEILGLPVKGIVNNHPGFLPEVKGNNCSLYAIIHDLPIGCSAHLIDEDIDTGPLLNVERLQLDWKNLTYTELLYHLNICCAEVCLDVVRNFERTGKFKCMPQEKTSLHDFGTFTAIEKIMKQHAIIKLESGGYSGGFDVAIRERNQCRLTRR
eukprot:augustus_masked-scaffold_7-processed-gene-10.11-mRNA-1 protein AED:1.00 eAED:1.00 QI:0/-1/0/0/-1/1/1/0/268